MTTKNNTKKFLSIIVIAIIGSMLFMACKAKPTDGSHSKSELTGTWNWTDNRSAVTTIDSDGNIKFFNHMSASFSFNWDYTGKISDTFDYPYTVEIVENNGGDKGTITFNSSSDATVSFYGYYWPDGISSGWKHFYRTLKKE